MAVTRHFVDIGDRRVHYRKAGSGPPLLMAHQSPRSSAEYVPLMERWSVHFTCIAPDTPGFGQSDPLPDAQPEVDVFADAILAFLDALGIARTVAYGFHSGGIILVAAAKRDPERFSALAVGGYAIWTAEERRAFAADYLPPFRPQPFGEHLAWLWHRILEQSWFFPWYDTRDAVRLPGAHADLARVDAVVREMLDSGDAYRTGYGAVLRAPRDIPAHGAPTPPVLIVAYDGDPLQAHIARLGPLPANWRAEPVRDAAALEAAALDHLRAHATAPVGGLAEAGDEGFVAVVAAGFAGLVHWRGDRSADRVLLHAPGRSVETLDVAGALAIDLPGHGLSDDWAAGASPSLEDWARVVGAAIAGLVDPAAIVVAGEGLSALLAVAVAGSLGARAAGFDAHIPSPDQAGRWIAQAIPDLAPDRFGAYLGRAWAVARAEQLFWPWFDTGPKQAIPFDPADLDPAALALSHRSLIRARAAPALIETLLSTDRNALFADVALAGWDVADWAAARDDIWRPEGRD